MPSSRTLSLGALGKEQKELYINRIRILNLAVEQIISPITQYYANDLDLKSNKKYKNQLAFYNFCSLAFSLLCQFLVIKLRFIILYISLKFTLYPKRIIY